MILTITPNPSVDISYQIDDFQIDHVNRVNNVKKDAGGKGIHVSYVLTLLGEKAKNSGFIGGSTGRFIEEVLEKKGILSDFVEIDGETRNCIAISHDSNSTEVLEKGPEVKENFLNLFMKKLDSMTKGIEYMSVSGSLPLGLNETFYTDLIDYAKQRGIFIAIDTSKEALRSVIEHKNKPDLIKPNIHELEQVTGKRYLNNIDRVVESLRQKPFNDIDYVICSLGKDGGVFKIKDKYYMALVPEIEAKNPVGSGDSTVAGALFAIKHKMSDESIIRYAMNCGLLNALEEEIAYVNMDLFHKYYKEIIVKELV